MAKTQTGVWVSNREQQKISGLTCEKLMEEEMGLYLQGNFNGENDSKKYIKIKENL